MLADEWPGSNVRSPESIGGTTFSLHVYLDDVDAMYKQAVAAGAKGVHPPEDQFWGDRYGMVVDPFGHSWGLATHIKDVSRSLAAIRGEEWSGIPSFNAMLSAILKPMPCTSFASW